MIGSDIQACYYHNPFIEVMNHIGFFGDCFPWVHIVLHQLAPFELVDPLEYSLNFADYFKSIRVSQASALTFHQLSSDEYCFASCSEVD